MVKSNEFTGVTLYDAVKKATAAYDRTRLLIERKDVCSDLALDLAEFKREAARAEDRAEELMREAETLADSARRHAFYALLNAAIAAAGAFGSSLRALRILKALRFRELSRSDWLGLVPVIGGGLLAGANALDAVNESIEARRLARKAEQEGRKAESLGDDLVRIADEYRRANCDASKRVS